MKKYPHSADPFGPSASSGSSRRGAMLLMLLAAAGFVATPAPALESPGFRIIVNPQNSVISLKPEFITDCFLKKVNSWDDGQGLQPVDQKANSEVRRAFSQTILRRSVDAVRTYWQHRVFSGRGVPPPELDDDAEVLRYVATHRGAIGYVSNAAKLDGVRVVVIH
jgi:hypothetical protein